MQKSVSHYFSSLFAATCNDGQCDAPRYQRVRAISAYDQQKKAPDCKFIDTKEDCEIALKELNLQVGYVTTKKRDEFYAKGCTWHRRGWGTYFNDPGASKCIWNTYGDPNTDCICKI